MTPDTPLRPGSQVTFDNLIGLAMQAQAAYKKTYSHALDIGIRPREILLYAQAAMPPRQRDAFQARLVQSPWALDRVVAIVKAKRARELPPLPDDDVAACEWLDML